MDEIRELDLKKVLNTLSTVNSARPQLETTPFPSGPRPQDPSGNFYAAGIKQIQDDSQSVFPESVYSDPYGRRKRWTTTYDKDYIPRQEEEFDKWMKEYMQTTVPECDKPGSAPAFMNMRAMHVASPRKTKDTLQLQEKDRMFMSWKVPSRLTDDQPSSRIGSRLQQLDELNPGCSIPTPSRVDTMKAILPDVTERAPPTPAHFRKVSQSATPRMMLTTPRNLQTPRITPTPSKCHTPGPDSAQFRSTNQPAPYRTKTYRTQELFKMNEKVPQYSTLQDFLHTASPHERRLIERTLKMIYNKDSGSQEAVRNVQRWLDKASDDDRKVALNFFSSIGVQMMGSATPQERQVVHKVINLLKDHTGRNPYNLQRSRTDVGKQGKGSNLQYVRLLTPNTRHARWQQQTWHHLPVYNDTDAVYNKSAVYTEPGRTPYRHWNIHPDWELKQKS